MSRHFFSAIAPYSHGELELPTFFILQRQPLQIHRLALPLKSGKCKRPLPPPRGIDWVYQLGAMVLTTCDWLLRLYKNLKLDFLI
jgi:hypothetical protein